MRAVATAFRVLESVAEEQPVGVSDLARIVDLPKSTVQRMLKTLEASGWIRPCSEDDPRWILTARVLTLGAHVGHSDALKAVAAEPMRSLGHATGETVHLVIPDGREVVLIAGVPSIHALQPVTALGAREPIHGTASGKAILAAMTDRERREILADGLPAVTPRTITDAAAFDDEMDRIRRLGWSKNEEEYRAGVSSVGVAIVIEGRPLAAVTLSMPSTRLDDGKAGRYAALLQAAARRIEAGLHAER